MNKKSINKITWIISFGINLWPLFLFIPQKALILPSYLASLRFPLIIYSKSMLVCIACILFTGITFAFQNVNPNSINHLSGFIIFLISIPIINFLYLKNKEEFIKSISIISIFNMLLGFLLFFNIISFENLRGLNQIRDSDGNITRVFYESASLLAAFNLFFIRRRILKYILYIALVIYLLFFIKSFFIIVLLGLRYYSSKNKFKLKSKIYIFLSILIASFFTIYISSIIRPDILLSLGYKYTQFIVILKEIEKTPFFGHGWGYFINEFASDENQPYQTEMQLPMLLLQIGIAGTILYLTTLFILIKIVSLKLSTAFSRFFIYLIIGFNNPWLFLPSWYLTAILILEPTDQKNEKYCSHLHP